MHILVMFYNHLVYYSTCPRDSEHEIVPANSRESVAILPIIHNMCEKIFVTIVLEFILDPGFSRGGP